MTDEAVEAMDRAGDEGAPVLISPITAWEIGLLIARGRLALPIDPRTWFNRLMQAPNLELAELTPDVLIASSFLPGKPPRDPSDRIMIATARSLSLIIVTRDRDILSYASAGHVRALAC